MDTTVQHDTINSISIDGVPTRPSFLLLAHITTPTLTLTRAETNPRELFDQEFHEEVHSVNARWRIEGRFHRQSFLSAGDGYLVHPINYMATNHFANVPQHHPSTIAGNFHAHAAQDPRAADENNHPYPPAVRPLETMKDTDSRAIKSHHVGEDPRL